MSIFQLRQHIPEDVEEGKLVHGIHYLMLVAVVHFVPIDFLILEETIVLV